MRHQLAYTIAVSLTLWIASCAGSDDESTLHDDQGFLIPLAKCCDVGGFYNAGFDSCLERDTLDMEVPGTYFDSNGTGHAVAPSAFLVSLTNLTICPNGHVVKTSTDFQIFEDGSLKTADGIVREPGEFCVNRIVSDSDSTAPLAMFASRLCIADPCANSSTGCIHKCCPTGMILNETERLCQPSSVPFVIPFHDESGTPLLPPTSVIVRDGVFVDCKHGAYSLRPSTEEDEEFYVLPNGRIHLPAIREYVDDYCIDQFASEDGTVLQALLCFPPQPEETAANVVIQSIYPYFLFVSSLFLIATFIVHALLPELRNTHGVTVMCHAASMSVMYIGLATIQLNPYLPDDVCIGLAVLVHFAFLATFTWLNVLSFDIWWTFNDRRLPRRSHQLGRRFIYYSLYAWSVPTLIVLFGQIVDNVRGLANHISQPGFGTLKCWFHTPGSFYIFLYGPMSVLILGNVFFFTMTAITLCRARIGTLHKDNASLFYSKQKFRAIFVLFVLMGISWMTEVISFAVGGSAYLWIPTDILNILTAVFVFFIFVCKPNVWSLLMKKYPCLQKFDRFCSSCMKYDNSNQENEDRSFIDLQQTAI